MTTTVTGLYNDYESATQAVKDLEAAGIPHTDVSIVANNAAARDSDTVTTAADEGDTATGAETGATIGAFLGGGAGLLAGLGMLAIPGLGPVVAAGWLASLAVGAVAAGAAGGIIGSLMHAGVSEEHAHVYAEGVRRGGALVSARVDDSKAPIARSIIARHNPVDPVEQGAAYRSTGWTRFDPDAPPYDATDVERDRLGGSLR